MIDSLLKLLQTPLGTVLAFAGIIIVFFAFFEAGKGTVKMRKRPKDGTTPAIIGAILIIGGLILNNSQTAAPVEPTPENPTAIPVAFTEVAPVIPTDTLITPTETISPTDTRLLASETLSPIPVKTFSDNCIDTQTWKADSTDADALGAVTDENNCLNLGSLGIAALDGTIHILPRSPQTRTAAGIYTPINNQSSIEFKVYVKSLYLVLKGDPAYITFSVAPQSNPMARQESGRFKLQVKDTGNSPLVLFMLANTTESNGVELGTQHYLYGRTYEIRLELKGIFMKVYINGVDTKRTITIPSGANVFYIGYNLPVLAGADVEIRDIAIDGVKK